MAKRDLSPAELEQRQAAALKHGVFAYEQGGRLPAEWPGDYDAQLALDLLQETDAPESIGYQLLARSVARRATLLELAYSFLGRSDVEAFWTETKNGRQIVRHQPILERLSAYHEGLRRDLQELGLTPLARARLDVGLRQLTLDELVDAPVGEGDGKNT